MNCCNLHRRTGRFAAISLLLLGLAGQPIAAQPLFTLDAAAFQQRGGLIYLEVYLMVQRDALTFSQSDSGFRAALEISLNLYAPDTLLSTTSWQVADAANKLEDINPRQKLPDIAIFPQLPPGSYRLQGNIKDLNRDTTFTRELSLHLKAFSDSSLSISDLELATGLEKTVAKGKFWKNGFRVIPNPERLYGPSMPLVYYYAEIYNLKDSTGSFLVDRIILDSERQEIKRLPQKSHQKVGRSAVEVDGISIASLSSGTYYLRLEVSDAEAGATAQRETKFFVFRVEDFAARAQVKEGAPTPDDLEIRDMSDAQVNAAVAELSYLLNDDEARSVTGLNAAGQREFLLRFWKERDPNPATAINEFRQMFEERKRYADDKFSYLGREGWKTDRGRIYILYGPADDVEYHTHDLDTYPYEIWLYDSIEGGVIFVFLDRNNFGDFRLVHSTKNGEINRPNWFAEEAAVRK